MVPGRQIAAARFAELSQPAVPALVKAVKRYIKARATKSCMVHEAGASMRRGRGLAYAQA